MGFRQSQSVTPGGLTGGKSQNPPCRIKDLSSIRPFTVLSPEPRTLSQAHERPSINIYSKRGHLAEGKSNSSTFTNRETEAQEAEVSCQKSHGM